MTHTLTFPHYDGFIELGCSRRLQQANAALGNGDSIHIEFIDHDSCRSCRRRRENFYGPSFAAVSGFGGRPQAHYRRHATILAVVDVLKTSLTYCSDGGVRVTFIVDTVLVVCKTRVQCTDLTVPGNRPESWNSQRLWRRR